MSDRGMSVLFVFMMIGAVILTIWLGSNRSREDQRYEKALAEIVCLNRCSNYNNGCRDACGEDTACQERCLAKNRNCVNGCWH